MLIENLDSRPKYVYSHSFVVMTRGTEKSTITEEELFKTLQGIIKQNEDLREEN